jgi:hypothetical protein
MDDREIEYDDDYIEPADEPPTDRRIDEEREDRAFPCEGMTYKDELEERPGGLRW